jgi:SpoVK/Ycf46/Vps4 family AAA+-type ATPase
MDVLVSSSLGEQQLDPLSGVDSMRWLSEKPNHGEIIRLLNLKFRDFERDFDSFEVADELREYSHADIERVCINAIRLSILRGQRMVSKKRFLGSIALESRRRDIARQD